MWEDESIIIGRKRKIPKESKSLKYMYFIKVDLKGKDTLKLGISNNVIRRMTEYNDENTVGRLKKVMCLFKCDYPKRIETFTKWKMRNFTRPVFSQEYYEFDYYELAVSIAASFAKDLNYRFIPTSIDEIKVKKGIEIDKDSK